MLTGTNGFFWGKLARYVKLYRALVVINLVHEMQFRLDFLMGILATVGWTLIAIVFMVALFGKVPAVAGWTYYELLVVLGFYRFLEGVGELVYYRGFKRFSEDIRRGRLDVLIAKPVDFQFYISARYLNIDSLSSALTGLAIFGYGLRHAPHAAALPTLLLFAALALSGLLLHYSLWVMVHAFNFWLIKVENLRNLIHGILGTTRFPPEAYGRKAEIFFSFVIPLALIVAFPVKTLLFRGEWWYLPFSLGLSVLLFVLSRRFFFYALRFYNSEGG